MNVFAREWIDDAKQQVLQMTMVLVTFAKTKVTELADSI